MADSSNSLLKTAIERIRGYLDDPDLEAKYSDDYIVRHIFQPAFASVTSRLNNSATNPVLKRLTFPLTKSQQYYQLPPCVGEVWRLAIVDESGVVTQEALPRGMYNYRGPNWQIEGNLLSFMPYPDADFSTMELWYCPSGDFQPVYGASGTGLTLNAPTLSGVQITGTAGQFSCSTASLYIGQSVTITGTLGGTGTISGYVSGTLYYIVATNGTTSFTLSTTKGGTGVTTTVGTPTGLTYTTSSTQVTFNLASATATLGSFDRRPGAYVGQMLRFIGTGTSSVVEERMIESWEKGVSSNWVATVRQPFVNNTAATAFELAPEGAEPMYEAVAAASAMKMAGYRKISGEHFGMIQAQYRDAMKTLMDRAANVQMRMPKAWQKDTVDNPLGQYWRI